MGFDLSEKVGIKCLRAGGRAGWGEGLRAYEKERIGLWSAGVESCYDLLMCCYVIKGASYILPTDLRPTQG